MGYNKTLGLSTVDLKTSINHPLPSTKQVLPELSVISSVTISQYTFQEVFLQ